MKQLSTDQLQRPDLETYKASEKMPVIVVLDNVRSGLNVGAVFRTCDAFSVEAVYLCGITATPPHAEIMKTALGATESVDWKTFQETSKAMDDLDSMGYTILAVEQTNQSLYLEKINIADWFPLAIVFGNEMRGVDAEILKRCQKSIEIPQRGIKHSLNVATSAGIVLWECYRQNLLRRLGSGL